MLYSTPELFTRIAEILIFRHSANSAAQKVTGGWRRTPQPPGSLTGFREARSRHLADAATGIRCQNQTTRIA